MTVEAESISPNPGIGVVAPVDFPLERELARWLPAGTPLTVASDTPAALAADPAVLAFACAPPSFAAGAAGERALRTALLEAGAPAAVTTAGALVEALAEVGATRIAVLSAYPTPLAGLLTAFLAEHGVTVAAAHTLAPTGPDLLAAAGAIDPTGLDAVFVSCAELPSYDLIAPLEQRLGRPVLTENQVVMVAAARAAGLIPVGAHQRLLSPAPVGAAA
jgi:maleate isomerase